MIEFRNVCTNHRKFSLNNISFVAKSGFITAIIGANGAGKTTLLGLMAKENRSSKYTGEILFDGMDIRTNHDKFRSMLGIICDERYFFDCFTANENVKLLSHFYPEWHDDIFREQMKAMNVSCNRKLSMLSRGEYIRFQLAFAMAHDARFYIMDEATAGMDPVFRKDFFKSIHELLATNPDITVIMTTHIEEDIKKHMDYIGVLDKGSLISFSEVV